MEGDAWEHRACRPRGEGVPGHSVIFSRRRSSKLGGNVPDSARSAFLVLALAGLFSSAPEPASAQEIPVVDSTHLVAVHAGRLIDGTGAEPREDVTILVRGGRIEAVGRDVDVPEEARVVDLTDSTVLPGLLEMHTHLTVDGVEVPLSRKYAEHPPGYQVAIGAKSARATLLAGFTTARNVGSWGWSSVALRDAVEARQLPGPRIFTAAHQIGIPGGHGDFTNGLSTRVLEERGPRQGMADTPGEAREAVHQQLKFGADVIKLMATGGVVSEGDRVGVQQMTEEEMRAAVEAAEMAGVRVAAHAHGTEGIKAAIRAGVHSIEHGSRLDREAIRMMKERGTYLVPTRLVVERVTAAARAGQIPPFMAEKALQIADDHRTSFRRAVEAGVKIAFGSDAPGAPHGENAGEFSLMVEAGMSPHEAILAATREAAKLLGEWDELGSVEAGKRADLIAVGSNPLEDVSVLEDVDFVMKGGVVYKRAGRPVPSPGR